jgi:hypothetical protein
VGQCDSVLANGKQAEVMYMRLAIKYPVNSYTPFSFHMEWEEKYSLTEGLHDPKGLDP